MIRGTTAQFKFVLPYNIADVVTIKINFWQDNYSGPDASRPLPIVKVRSQCILSHNPKEVMVCLNKEETLRFLDDRKAYVQLHGKTMDGTAFASKRTEIVVYPLYDDSILGDDIVPTPSPDDNWIILDGETIV